MSRRPRRLLPLLLPVLLGVVLTSCGDDEGGGTTTGGSLDSVAVTGTVGSSVEVKWDGELTSDGITTEVLSEGDGDQLAEGDQVLAHVWVGNGFTQEKAFSTYDSEQPELLTIDDQLSAVFREAFTDQAVGSRVAVAAPAEDAFGPQGNPELGIGNKDTVLVVADLLSAVLEEPTGEEGDAAAWAPEIVETDGAPTGFDFAKAPEPNDELRETTLIQGEGAKVEKGQTIVVDYLGQVYDGKKPFDDSYSKGQATSFQIGKGAVIKGWDQTLVGEPIGSRVVLAIPPDLGYGPEGNPEAKILGTDTLYFVIDILGAG